MKRKFKTKRYGIKKERANVLKNNEKLIILIFSFLSGLALGALIIKNSKPDMLEFVNELITGTFSLNAPSSVLKRFTSYLLPDLVAVTVSSVFGLCIVGEPVIWLIPAIRGLGLGLTVGYMYLIHGISCLVFCILFIALPAAFTVGGMIICCKENILTSVELRKSINKNTADRAVINCKMFAVRIIISVSIITVFALLSSIAAAYFSSRIGFVL